MSFVLLIAVAVLGYLIYTLYREKSIVNERLKALENELLELPPNVHAAILEEYKKREFVENVLDGDLSKLGEVAKRAEELSKKKTEEGVSVSDLLQSDTDIDIKRWLPKHDPTYNNTHEGDDGSSKPLYGV